MFTVGADPEVFVGNSTGLVCAHNMVPGTKDQPSPVKDGSVQVDGIALEFNIEPVDNEDAFVNNINSVMGQLEGMIGDNKFLKDASVFFDEDWMKSVPLESLLLGCEPDFNAWQRAMNNPPDADAMMRTAGGHIHVGFKDVDNPYDMDHMEQCASLAKLLDKFVGVPSLSWDTDDDRRSLYGLAGSFRPKKYGMEYRTLSNAWCFDENLIRRVYRGVTQAVEALNNKATDVEDFIEDIINKSDRSHPYFLEAT